LFTRDDEGSLGGGVTGARLRQRRDQPKRSVRGFQQNPAAVRTGMRLAKSGDQRTIKQIGEENILWSRGLV
jgi:hypothetical protein